MKVEEERPIRWSREARELAEREGIDLTLLESNLRMTFAERIRANGSALGLVKALQAGRIVDSGRSGEDSG